MEESAVKKPPQILHRWGKNLYNKNNRQAFCMDGAKIHGRGMGLCIYGKEGHAIWRNGCFF